MKSVTAVLLAVLVAMAPPLAWPGVGEIARCFGVFASDALYWSTEITSGRYSMMERALCAEAVEHVSIAVLAMASGAEFGARGIKGGWYQPVETTAPLDEAVTYRGTVETSRLVDKAGRVIEFEIDLGGPEGPSKLFGIGAGALGAGTCVPEDPRGSTTPTPKTPAPKPPAPKPPVPPTGPGPGTPPDGGDGGIPTGGIDPAQCHADWQACSAEAWRQYDQCVARHEGQSGYCADVANKALEACRMDYRSCMGH